MKDKGDAVWGLPGFTSSKDTWMETPSLFQPRSAAIGRKKQVLGKIRYLLNFFILGLQNQNCFFLRGGKNPYCPIKPYACFFV